MNFHEDFVIKSSPTGSNYICNPPVTTTDIDTVFLVTNIAQSDVALVSNSWNRCIGEGYEVLGGDFQAYRKGNKNYIITQEPTYYAKYVRATKICKMMNLLNKEDRIWMFKVVMDGEYLPSNFINPTTTTVLPSQPTGWVYDEPGMNWLTVPLATPDNPPGAA